MYFHDSTLRLPTAFHFEHQLVTNLFLGMAKLLQVCETL